MPCSFITSQVHMFREGWSGPSCATDKVFPKLLVSLNNRADIHVVSHTISSVLAERGTFCSLLSNSASVTSKVFPQLILHCTRPSFYLWLQFVLPLQRETLWLFLFKAATVPPRYSLKMLLQPTTPRDLTLVSLPSPLSKRSILVPSVKHSQCHL